MKLLDGNGRTIASGTARAQGEWMTNEYVPFKATLTFDQPSTNDGVLVLVKNDPSGLAEDADEFRVPVHFGPLPPKPLGGCRTTGCSGQICAEEEMMTTCEFRPEYACYQGATCERQPGGKCGWTMSMELQRCLGQAAQ